MSNEITEKHEIQITTEFIKLDQLLKWAGIIESGGQVKLLLADELIKLNGAIETAKRRKIKPGDIIEISFGNRTTKAEVIAVEEAVRKEAAGELFRYL